MQTTEQRLERLEKHYRRLTMALTLIAVAMCAVVTMAATGDKDGDFDRVEARTIWVKSDAGEYVVGLGASDYGGGAIQVYNKMGKIIVHMHEDEYGNGVVGAYKPKGMGRTLQPGP